MNNLITNVEDAISRVEDMNRRLKALDRMTALNKVYVDDTLKRLTDVINTKAEEYSRLDLLDPSRVILNEGLQALRTTVESKVRNLSTVIEVARTEAYGDLEEVVKEIDKHLNDEGHAAASGPINYTSPKTRGRTLRFETNSNGFWSNVQVRAVGDWSPKGSGRTESGTVYFVESNLGTAWGSVHAGRHDQSSWNYVLFNKANVRFFRVTLNMGEVVNIGGSSWFTVTATP